MEREGNWDEAGRHSGGFVFWGFGGVVRAVWEAADMGISLIYVIFSDCGQREAWVRLVVAFLRAARRSDSRSEYRL